MSSTQGTLYITDHFPFFSKERHFHKVSVIYCASGIRPIQDRHKKIIYDSIAILVYHRWHHHPNIVTLHQHLPHFYCLCYEARGSGKNALWRRAQKIINNMQFQPSLCSKSSSSWTTHGSTRSPPVYSLRHPFPLSGSISQEVRVASSRGPEPCRSRKASTHSSSWVTPSQFCGGRMELLLSCEVDRRKLLFVALCPPLVKRQSFDTS